MLDGNDINLIRRMIAAMIAGIPLDTLESVIDNGDTTTIDAIFANIDVDTLKSRHGYHKDSFGLLQTVVTGASTWTTRLLRTTKIALPHIAKNDVFTYKAQYNHDKALLTNCDDFHIHIIPIGAVTAGQVINLDYAYVWIKAGDVYPNTLPNTGTIPITLATGDQYKMLIKAVISNLVYPTNESYSSELFIQITRRNDGTDTYAGEFALLDGDSHYLSNQFGSFNTLTD
jgi:hypothetical protein